MQKSGMFDYSMEEEKKGYMRESFVNEDEGESLKRQSMKGSGKKGVERNLMVKKLYPE